MKPLKSFVFALSLAMLAVGCKNAPPQQQELALLAAQTAVTGGTTAATALVIRNNLQTVPDFQAGEVVLSQMAGNPTELSTNNVTTIMQQLGVTNSDVTAVVSGAILTVQPFLDTATNAVQTQQYLVDTLQWTSTGIGVGIPLGEVLAQAKASKK